MTAEMNSLSKEHLRLTSGLSETVTKIYLSWNNVSPTNFLSHILRFNPSIVLFGIAEISFHLFIKQFIVTSLFNKNSCKTEERRRGNFINFLTKRILFKNFK